MNLKKCSCGKQQTTKNAQRVSRQTDQEMGFDMIYFNCTDCKSTFVVTSEETKKRLDESRMRRAA